MASRLCPACGNPSRQTSSMRPTSTVRPRRRPWRPIATGSIARAPCCGKGLEVAHATLARRLAAAAVLLGVMSGGAAAPLPPIHHVFVLMLENQNAAVTFGSGSPAPYLAHTLTAQGAFLPNYYGIGHASLDNYIALVSGQAPNEKTQLDCPLYSDF